jgi:hypothetical protein
MAHPTRFERVAFLRRATLYLAELRVLTAYAVLQLSEPQRVALPSHFSTIAFLPRFSHQPAGHVPSQGKRQSTLLSTTDEN